LSGAGQRRRGPRPRALLHFGFACGDRRYFALVRRTWRRSGCVRDRSGRRRDPGGRVSSPARQAFSIDRRGPDTRPHEKVIHMAVTAQQVKELREATGVGMMDCKKALEETNGDMEAAIDWLRTRGLAKAAKKAGRVAAEGLVAVAVSGNRGAIVEVNSETDFVARNEQFQDIVGNVAQLALSVDGDVEALGAAGYPGTGRNVADELTNAIATIGENLSLRRSAALSVADGVVG